ncbi:MAG: YhcH/YjgK/YiaL family protein [Bacteroidaceae bacterium]|nr:YhcH/YjgK/YiaL family protein [Bacteroidaceae bacterium]
MILDNIDALSKYEGLNPRFHHVVSFLKNTDLNSLSTGVHEICGKDVYVNIQEMKPRGKDEARWESHEQMIDIQLLLSGDEQHGWLPLAALPAAEFDKQNDIAFYDGYEQLQPMPVEPTYFRLSPMQMAIYFPEDVHKPAITEQGLRKAIFKVRNN